MRTGEIINTARLKLGLSKYAFARLMSRGLISPIGHQHLVYWERNDVREDTLYYRMFYLYCHAPTEEVKAMARALLVEMRPELSPDDLTSPPETLRIV